MNLAKIELEYNLREKLTKIMIAELETAIKAVPEFFENREFNYSPVDGTELFRVDYWHAEYIVDLDYIWHTPISIKARLDLRQAIQALAEKQNTPAFNDHVQVVIPSNATLRINRVKVVEDCCTDHLQDQLNAGWRIIAACPQSQRRPDYILGRVEDDGHP